MPRISCFVALISVTLGAGLTRCTCPGEHAKQPSPLPTTTPFIAESPTGADLATIVRRLTDAHYDPSRLGLSHLSFAYTLNQAQSGLHVEGTGEWHAGKRVEAIPRAVTIGDKPVTKDGSPEDKRNWLRAAQRSQGLLSGLGSGFLSSRLAEFAKMKGTLALEGDRLHLTFSEGGQVLEAFANGAYQIVEIREHHHRGVTRTMTYESESLAGRYLVTVGKLSVLLDGDATIKPAQVAMLKAADGTSFHFTFTTVNGYRLPTKLVKDVPGAREHIDVTITYQTAER